eukprot:3091816-Pleurochrysis_carterae.AAC.1
MPFNLARAAARRTVAARALALLTLLGGVMAKICQTHTARSSPPILLLPMHVAMSNQWHSRRRMPPTRAPHL